MNELIVQSVTLRIENRSSCKILTFSYFKLKRLESSESSSKIKLCFFFSVALVKLQNFESAIICNTKNCSLVNNCTEFES